VLAGTRVEVADVVAAVREHHRAGRVASRPPVRDQPGSRALRGVLDVDAVVRLIADDRPLCVALTQLVKRGALPAADLAVVLGQLDRQAAIDESAERAAGFELGQLAMVTDEHELAATRRGGLDQLRELPRRDHARLIHDEHAAFRQRPMFEAAEQRGDARAADAGAVL